ncbi:LysE family translocator [Desulfomicrobium salsuginis]
MGYYLTLGALLGLSAGLAPGPLLTLVISETLRHDVRAGVRVALAPMVTDLPIILLTLFVLSRLAGFHGILGAISIAGGIFILSMGYEGLRTKGFDVHLQDAPRKSLRKGILTNMLSPHPYLFWFGVGAPTMTRALDVNLLAPAAFIAGFYACLVGSKIALALLVGRSKSFFKGKAYVWTMRLLGMALVVLALMLFRDGLQLTGLVAAPQT